MSCNTTDKIVSGGDWNGYDYSYFCPSYCFGEKGKTAGRLDVLNINHLSLASKDYLNAIEVSKKYICERGGTAFLNNVYFVDIDITYLDSLENFKNKRPLRNIEKCGQTMYFIRFLFKPERNTEYRFGIAMTEKFNIISTAQFPDSSTTPDFDRIVTPTDAFKTAKKEHHALVTPLKSIELTYDEKLDCFIWEIKSEGTFNDKNKPHEYETGYVLVNASTGKIMENGIRTGRVIVDPAF